MNLTHTPQLAMTLRGIHLGEESACGHTQGTTRAEPQKHHDTQEKHHTKQSNLTPTPTTSLRQIIGQTSGSPISQADSIGTVRTRENLLMAYFYAFSKIHT